MKLYIDIFSNDEIISDSYNMEMIYENVGCKVKSQYLVKDEKYDVYGAGNAFANPDAKEEEVNNEVVKVLDVMDSFDYKETVFDKKSYGTYLKAYMGKILEHLTKNKPDRVEAFKVGAKAMGSWIMSNYGDFTFYTPKSYDSENSIILSYFEKDAETPTFVYFLDGLRTEKC